MKLYCGIDHLNPELGKIIIYFIPLKLRTDEFKYVWISTEWYDYISIEDSIAGFKKQKL